MWKALDLIPSNEKVRKHIIGVVWAGGEHGHVSEFLWMNAKEFFLYKFQRKGETSAEMEQEG